VSQVRGGSRGNQLPELGDLGPELSDGFLERKRVDAMGGGMFNNLHRNTPTLSYD
jgi:hypothetical protein